MPNVIEILKTLISYHTVTPDENGILNYVENFLKPLGYTSHIVEFFGVKNLYAYNSDEPKLCFAGHLDVVPVGDKAAWRSDPFILEEEGDKLYGRGVVDMKGAVAAFMSVLESVKHKPLALLLTMDEEGPAEFGTVKMLEYIKQMQLPMFTHAIVGEPTSEQNVVDMIKIGRRGSLSARIVIEGVQGHVAYPDKARNPCSEIVKVLEALKHGWTIDEGNSSFDASNLEIVSIDVGNKAMNVIPHKAAALINIRYCTEVSALDLKQEIERIVKQYASSYMIDFFDGAEPFINLDEEFAAFVCKEVCDLTGASPTISTTGGTSDARFISKYAKTIELGLKNDTAHKVDECCTIQELQALSEVYYKIFSRF